MFLLLQKTFSDDLPEPVCLQCINMNEKTINVAFFQLNTLNLTSDNGIKNMAWFDTANHLCWINLSRPWLGEEYKKKQYDEFDSVPFLKLLAAVCHGLPEIDDL